MVLWGFGRLEARHCGYRTRGGETEGHRWLQECNLSLVAEVVSKEKGKNRYSGKDSG